MEGLGLVVNRNPSHEFIVRNESEMVNDKKQAEQVKNDDFDLSDGIYYDIGVLLSTA